MQKANTQPEGARLGEKLRASEAGSHECLGSRLTERAVALHLNGGLSWPSAEERSQLRQGGNGLQGEEFLSPAASLRQFCHRQQFGVSETKVLKIDMRSPRIAFAII